MDKLSKAIILCVVLAGTLIAAPVNASLKQVIEPQEKAEFGFPLAIRQGRAHYLKLAEPKENEQPGPLGAGIDECAAHCPNGTGW